MMVTQNKINIYIFLVLPYLVEKLSIDLSFTILKG